MIAAPSFPEPYRVTVDLDAIAQNVRALDDMAGSANVIAVVKANAYGHGLLPSAFAAVQGGAAWLATAALREALQIRAAGIDAPLLCWLHAPQDAAIQEAVAQNIDLGIGHPHMLDQALAAAETTGQRVAVHLKLDTGLGRNGLTFDQLRELTPTLLKAQAGEQILIRGIFSHFAIADAPEHPTVLGQVDTFREMDAFLVGEGIDAELRHLANSAATLTRPDTYFDLVRPGLAVYGLSPVPDIGGPEKWGLKPAMRMEARLAAVKEVPAGTGLSYGHTYITPTDTEVALVPTGYCDGIPRSASNEGPVQIAGERYILSGRVCMDQFVVDVGAQSGIQPGDSAVIFGDGSSGEPTAEDWAQASGTISYEIVTRIAPNTPRTYTGAVAVAAGLV